MNALSISARLGAISLPKSALITAALALASAASTSAQHDAAAGFDRSPNPASTYSTGYAGGGATAKPADAALALELIDADHRIDIRIRGGMPNSAALLLVGTASANIDLAPVGITGTLQVSQVFASIRVQLDARGAATTSIDLDSTLFGDHRIDLHLQVLTLDSPRLDAGGEASNAALVQFFGRPTAGPSRGNANLAHQQAALEPGRYAK